MQSSDRNVFSDSQSRADRAFHIPRTVSSTDTCELAFLYRQCRCLACCPQEPPGALLAHDVGRLAVEEYRTATDENRFHGVVVAVHHAGGTAVVLDGVLGILVQR